MPPRPRISTPRNRAPTARSFLFCDLRDYTSFVEAKGDAAAARLLREYRTLVRREVARHAGAEVKTEGDSFYVVFDSASSALECAVTILRAAETRSAKDPTAPLRIGVGLHAGETVEYDDQFVGSAVNIASRLAGKAGAMELLISDTLRGLVRTSQRLAMTDRGPLELKGVAEPIRAWSVNWRDDVRVEQAPVQPVIASAPQTAPASGQLLCPVVIGRTTEMARFDAALAASVAGRGQVVVLGGEAGVGKTRFVRDAQARATAGGARVLVGLTHQSDTTLPYAPFVSAIRSGFHALDRDELGRVLQRSAPDLAELFPELGQIQRAAESTGLERHRLGVAFQHLFRAFARETPVLVVLEDLHWADETSLELLLHLARELRDARVLLLATYRSDEMHRRHPFLRALAELQRERLATEIQLKRLTPEETSELIRATMATRDPNVRVSDEFRDAIYARTDGNPFFTEELLKALVESGGIFWRDDGWARKPIHDLEIPGSIREAVRARVEQLTPDARATLSVAAVIGHHFQFETLRAVSGEDETALERHLREFIEGQLVNEGDDADEEYSFRHALTREVVYDDLLVRERKRFHRAVADAIVASAGTEPALVAHHLLAAGENARAVPKLLEAARRASRAAAPREAAAHYERILEISLPDDQLPGVLEELAEACELFDESRSLKAAEEAAVAYRERGDRRGLSRMLRLASRNRWLKGDGDAAFRAAEEAVAAVADDESVEHARGLAHLAGLHMTAAARDEAIAAADRAIAIAERLGDAYALSNALITRGSAIGYLDPVTGVEIIDRGRVIAVEHEYVVTAARGWNNMSLWLSGTGWAVERRFAFMREGLEWAKARGLESGGLSFLRQTYAMLLAQTARFDEALTETEGTVASGLPTGRALLLLLTLARSGPAALRGRAQELLTIGRRSRDAQLYVPLTTLAALALAFEDKRPEAIEALADLHTRIGSDAGGRTFVGGPWNALGLGIAMLLAYDPLIEDVANVEGSPGPAAELRQLAVRVARATRAGRTAEAGRELSTYWAIATRDVLSFQAAQLTLLSVLTTGREIVAIPEWAPALRAMREYAGRAKADWWITVVPEPALA